jgi:hypothetical protein
MATCFPRTRESLLDIYGVGTVKCDKFGAAFMEIVEQFCRTHSIPERPQKPYKSSPGGP